MRIIAFLTFSILLAVSRLGWAQADINNVRIWQAPDNVRLVFDVSAPVTHNIFMLDNPERLVLDIRGSQLKLDMDKLGLEKGPIKSVRTGPRDDGVRIVFDLNSPVTPKSFELKPNDQYGDRLVLDLELPDKTTSAVANIATPETPAAVTMPPVKLRDIVIAIDAGHGGEDPGALGKGVREKDITLKIAKDLYQQINAKEGYKAFLTRKGDYYVSLRGRTKEARKLNADLFVSIHADAARDKRARGASVWVLSGRGATSEMGRWLARKENSADLIGGVGSVSLEDKDDTLASVLLDMSMTASQSNSREVAKRVHTNISHFARMHKSFVEQAGFVVLKSPDIPSMLVETGFISNPAEARQLQQHSYQKKMATAIMKGITAHFWDRPPSHTYVAARKYGNVTVAGGNRTYKVVSGDTLSVIAVRNGVSLQSLRQANNINGDSIRVGQVLKIPAG